MASGSEAYAGINAGRSRRSRTPASRRTSTRGTGSVATANGFPIF